ncbi:MAG TPA: hypothetical protein VEO56_15290 [Bacteroidota bacterium]|nr:hypothetical protein [Bacteroidota bacterium]
MSIYTSLGFPVPVISYSIVHRALSGVASEEYVQTMTEMHRRVEAESAQVAELHANAAREIANRQAQNLRGALSEFLQTPIRSDDAQVQRIFGENLAKYGEQIAESGSRGVFASMEGALLFQAGGSAALKKLETNGRRYLRSLGIAGGKGPASFYESFYAVRGSENLDVLEHIVRDRIGIYGPTHGKHITESADFAVAAHNLVHSSGGDYWKSAHSAWAECALFFSKPQLPYQEFRGAVGPAIDAIVESTGVLAASLWQRKLGLGRGSEFALRLLLDEKAQLGEIIERFREMKDPAFFRSAILVRGSLLLKEILYPRKP